MAKYNFIGLSEQGGAANRRRADALALRREGHWRGAMYLYGYVIECRFKARLMEKHGANTLKALEEKLSARCGKNISLFGKQGHDLPRLLELSEARSQMDEKILTAFNQCAKWRVDWRYDPKQGNERDCNEFFTATEKVLNFISGSM